MNRERLDGYIAAATRAAFAHDQSAVLSEIERLLATETDDFVGGSLLMARAIARQAHADPTLSADDGREASLRLRRSGHHGRAALASANAAGMVQRTGNLAEAIDLTFEAMMLMSEAELSDPDVVRAANGLAVLFAQLTAFDLALEASQLAFESVDAVLPEGRDALCYTVAYVTVEARHAGLDHIDEGPGRAAAARLWEHASSDLNRCLLGGGMLAEFDILDGDHSRFDDLLAGSDAYYDQVAPRLGAWHRLVRATTDLIDDRAPDARCHLEQALPALQAARDDHRIVRARDQLVRARMRCGDHEGAAKLALESIDHIRALHVGQIGRLSSQIAQRVELERAGTRLRRRLDLLTHEMAVDAVTGVGSRRWLETTLDEYENVRGDGAVVMFDLDHFKAVNDRFGHQVGDDVLAAVGSVLRQLVRASDLVGRYGGEEFVAIMPNASAAVAADLADRIREAVRDYPWDTIADGLAVQMSAGAAAGPLHRIREVLVRADEALYEAKRAGRNRVAAVA